MTGEQSTPAEGTPPEEAHSADADPEETAAILDELFAVVEERKQTLPDDSYTASLFTHEKGENAVLEKLGEETTELLLAAKDDDRDEIAHESADIVYHLLVLLSMKEMDLADLRAELRERR
ncbi:phosphoribosyl-ATP diphosphatase [Halorussus salinus]|uniref:phosphoribosyl-ATP diphosphatase n=1 Tax=Halorussus salinus TaxID=1364935 RepID=UPI0010928563|nr:phosphoribosyl-ATP diphosphatase [Halorussus salinus]